MLYSNDKLEYISRKILKSRIIFYSCLALTIIFNVLMMFFSKYETNKIYKIYTSICDSIIFIFLISFYLLEIKRLKKIYFHFKQIIVDKGSLISGYFLNTEKKKLTLSYFISAYEYKFISNDEPYVVYLLDIFDDTILKENTNYSLVISNHFIKEIRK